MKTFLYTVLFFVFICIFNVNALLSADIKHKKVMYIDSYSLNYPWSSKITSVISKIMDENRVDLRIFHMDTKENYSDEYKKKSALKAYNAIQEYKPDLIISTDDNAAKYLVDPYLLDMDIPIVFAGINWSAADYKFVDDELVTGMIEVSGIDELLRITRTVAKGNVIGFLSSDTATEHKDVKYINEIYNIKFDKTVYVSEFEEWKKQFINLQKEVDIIYIGNVHGINNFNKEEAIEFVETNISLPTCSTLDFTSEFGAINYIRLAEEQGEYVAETAIRILNGSYPSDIPVVMNKKGRVLINNRLVNKLKLDIPTNILEVADFLYE